MYQKLIIVLVAVAVGQVYTRPSLSSMSNPFGLGNKLSDIFHKYKGDVEMDSKVKTEEEWGEENSFLSALKKAIAPFNILETFNRVSLLFGQKNIGAAEEQKIAMQNKMEAINRLSGNIGSQIKNIEKMFEEGLDSKKESMKSVQEFLKMQMEPLQRMENELTKQVDELIKNVATSVGQSSSKKKEAIQSIEMTLKNELEKIEAKKAELETKASEIAQNIGATVNGQLLKVSGNNLLDMLSSSGVDIESFTPFGGVQEKLEATLEKVKEISGGLKSSVADGMKKDAMAKEKMKETFEGINEMVGGLSPEVVDNMNLLEILSSSGLDIESFAPLAIVQKKLEATLEKVKEILKGMKSSVADSMSKDAKADKAVLEQLKEKLETVKSSVADGVNEVAIAKKTALENKKEIFEVVNKEVAAGNAEVEAEASELVGMVSPGFEGQMNVINGLTATLDNNLEAINEKMREGFNADDKTLSKLKNEMQPLFTSVEDTKKELELKIKTLIKSVSDMNGDSNVIAETIANINKRWEEKKREIDAMKQEHL